MRPDGLIVTCGMASLLLLVPVSSSGGTVTSENNQRLRQALQRYPDADANGDGVLTMGEARAYLRRLREKKAGRGPARVPGEPQPAKRKMVDSWQPLAKELRLEFARADFLRVATPVVLSGKALLGLRGCRPGEVVAFRYAGRWQQIPVQVDERAVVEYADIYNRQHLKQPCFQNLVYTDAQTFTGPDPDASLDDDDEVAFMARDSGERPGRWSDPTGVVAGSGVEVELTDPPTGVKSYVYLFRSAGTLDPSAGKRYVRYEFRLKSGDYRKSYKLARGPNPEDSTVETAAYTRHFSDRWISDSLAIKAPLGSGVDILDMHKKLFAPGVPARSVKTFCAGEGAFITNKSGPVRAIRSVMGCNSGPLTQETLLFYDRREDCHIFLRVHPIPGVINFIDYSAAARGMRYHNNLNPDGVPIDGQADAMQAGRPSWEMVRGKQGTLVTLHRLLTNLPGQTPVTYYLDAESPLIPQISGDRHAYASSGPWFRRPILNTDPRRAGAGIFAAHRIHFYERADAPPDIAHRRLAEAAIPLVARVTAIGSGGDRN
ncbi:hypothetical protein ACFL09_06435 [Planctomycetota bacterium]